MTQAIVTGATGFIGSYFVEFLLSKKIEVISLGRKKWESISEVRKKRLHGSKYLTIDMSNINSLKSELNKKSIKLGEDCVFINLAWGGESRLSDLSVEHQLNNVGWTINAFKVADTIGCIKFIQIGTMEEAFTFKYLNLDHNTNNEYNRHVIYSVAKIASKKGLQLISKNSKCKFIYVLHSHVMAPDDDKDSFLQVTLEKLLNNEELIFSSGEQTFDVVSEKDCALGYYLICTKGKPNNQYWVGSGDPKPLREYVERMYNMYPSSKEMHFGKLKYNDIKLDVKDFSIDNLVRDTGYIPQNSYEEIVEKLYKSLITKNK